MIARQLVTMKHRSKRALQTYSIYGVGWTSWIPTDMVLKVNNCGLPKDSSGCSRPSYHHYSGYTSHHPMPHLLKSVDEAPIEILVLAAEPVVKR